MLQLVEVVDVAFERLALDGQGQLVVVVGDLFCLQDRPDDLPLVLID